MGRELGAIAGMSVGGGAAETPDEAGGLAVPLVLPKVVNDAALATPLGDPTGATGEDGAVAA